MSRRNSLFRLEATSCCRVSEEGEGHRQGDGAAQPRAGAGPRRWPGLRGEELASTQLNHVEQRINVD